jgi:type IV secretion system protein VirB9
MKYIISFFILSLVLGELVPSPSMALQVSRPVATDKRIRTVRYNENEVYKFMGHYGYQSIIEFSPSEEVAAVSLGDSIAWQITPVNSRLFLKPVEQDAMTNMTVITNERTYHFELHAEETEKIDDNDMIFVLRFVYPGAQQLDFTTYYEEDGVPDLEDPEVLQELNFNYSIVGSESISPIRIFDDGEFTYFQFQDVNAEVPAFYYVDPTMQENLINYRTNGDYIVVERVASQFTLRNGGEIVCVFNEARPMRPAPVPLDDGGLFGF